MYIFFSLATIILSFILFKKSSGTLSLLQINFISYVYYFHLLLQSFIGVNLVIFGFADSHYLIGDITNEKLEEQVYFHVALVLIIMPLSMLFVNFVANFKSGKEWYEYKNKPVAPLISNRDNAVFIVMLVLSTVSIVSILYTFILIGTIPQLNALFGNMSSEELLQLRIDSTRNFNGIVYIRNILGMTLTPILSYVLYVYSIKFSDLMRWKFLFWVMFTFSLIIITYNLEKAPLLFYLITFIFIKVLIYGKIKVKSLIFYGIGSISLIIAMYLIMNFNSNFLSITSGPLGRIFLGQITGLYFHELYFPNHIDFLNGGGFSSIITELYGLENVRSARIVMEMVNPKGVESGIAGVMNTLFIAEAYANFGFKGILFSIIYVGFLIQIVYIVFLRISKNPVTISLFAYLTTSLPITGGFFDFIYNPSLILVLIILIFLYFASQVTYSIAVKTK